MEYFSVIIPLYNKENHIENTLKSVLNQTYPYFEIILIDDGSTDESASKTALFKEARLRVFHQKNRGASRARNFGIEQANHNYIAFLDADDLWKENHLATLHQMIQDFPMAGIIASGYELIFKKGRSTSPNFKGISDTFYGIVPNYFDASLNYAVATSSSIAVPKAVFKAIGAFNPNISSGQDVDMWARIALNYPVALSAKVTASYLHYIENSLSKTPILKKSLNDFSAFGVEEKTNPSLKKYLDLYRIEYALQYKIAGENQKSKDMIKNVAKENRTFKTNLLLHLPQFFLVFLLNCKRFLRKKGIDFSIYQ